MALINKDNLDKAYVEKTPSLDESYLEFESDFLTWQTYAKFVVKDGKPEIIEPWESAKSYSYTSPTWYNKQKGGKKRKNRRF